eukprot:2427023-Ditylum_brightwellii.AAC.1
MWESSMLKIIGDAGQMDFPLPFNAPKKVAIVVLHVHCCRMHMEGFQYTGRMWKDDDVDFDDNNVARNNACCTNAFMGFRNILVGCGAL